MATPVLVFELLDVGFRESSSGVLHAQRDVRHDAYDGAGEKVAAFCLAGGLVRPESVLSVEKDRFSSIFKRNVSRNTSVCQ